MENEVWEEGQLGLVEGVLGTVDQLIINRCIMGDVKQYHRNLAITFTFNDVNLIRSINAKVISVAAYPMNVCEFTVGELKELDQVIKPELRSKSMLGRQSSNARLYLRREDDGKGIKLLKYIYKKRRLRVACYIVTLKQVDQHCMEKREGGELQ